MYPPIGRTQLNEARSGLTPTVATPAPDGTRQWTHEESFQSYFWDGFTTQEVRRPSGSVFRSNHRPHTHVLIPQGSGSDL